MYPRLPCITREGVTSRFHTFFTWLRFGNIFWLFLYSGRFIWMMGLCIPISMRSQLKKNIPKIKIAQRVSNIHKWPFSSSAKNKENCWKMHKKKNKKISRFFVCPLFKFKTVFDNKYVSFHGWTKLIFRIKFWNHNHIKLSQANKIAI